MNDPGKCLMMRVVRRIPANMLKTTLTNWGRVSEAQLGNVDFKMSKRAIADRLISICEENELTVKHVAELEMLYVIDNPKLGMWYGFQLFDPEDDAPLVDMTQFKEQFKFHLCKLMRNVSIKIKKHTDEAILIRVAWGDGFSRPNHLKPTYVVHYLHSSYVFVTSVTSKVKPLLSQTLVLSTRYQGIKDANLSGKNLAALRNLLMRQYQQVFSTKYPTPLSEKSDNITNPQIEREQADSATKRHQMACEAFGDGVLPQLQSAVYKLETKFKDHNNRTMTEREEPFKCVVKFASTNLLESLRHCASSDVSSVHMECSQPWDATPGPSCRSPERSCSTPIRSTSNPSTSIPSTPSPSASTCSSLVSSASAMGKRRRDSLGEILSYMERSDEALRREGVEDREVSKAILGSMTSMDVQGADMVAIMERIMSHMERQSNK